MNAEDILNEFGRRPRDVEYVTLRTYPDDGTYFDFGFRCGFGHFTGWEGEPC